MKKWIYLEANEETKELLNKIEKVMDEYNEENIQPNELIKGFEDLVNNRV